MRPFWFVLVVPRLLRVSYVLILFNSAAPSFLMFSFVGRYVSFCALRDRLVGLPLVWAVIHYLGVSCNRQNYLSGS